MKKLEQIIDNLDYLVPMIFGPGAQIEIPDQGDFIEKIYGNRLGPLIDYAVLKVVVMSNPSPENIAKMNDLNESLGLGGAEQEEFMNKLKQYISELKR